MTRALADGLTGTQRRVLDAIRDHIASHGYPPTLREIGAVAGRSTSTVGYQVGRLEALGRVRRDPRRPRRSGTAGRAGEGATPVADRARPRPGRARRTGAGRRQTEAGPAVTAAWID